MNTDRLKDHVAIITGGGSGFGKSIAHAFAGEGARIVIADLNAEAGKHVAQTLTDAGHAAFAHPVDVSKSSDMRDLVHAALQRFGQIDIMVNNAGMSHPNGPMLDVTEEFFDRLFAVNVKSIYLSAVHCVPVFRRQKRGCFINIGSTAAVRPRHRSTALLQSRRASAASARCSRLRAYEWRRRSRSPSAQCANSDAPGK
jgi:3-oxoacyl-[acyl-carrier protein] reductase